jgi:hypothetical protein
MLNIFILTFIYILIGYYIYKKFYKVFGWTHPLVWLYLFGFINYPIRAIILMNDGYSRVMPKLLINEFNVSMALIYVLLFLILRCIFTKSYTEDLSSIKEVNPKSISNALKAYKILVLICISIELYFIATGRLYTLGENYGNKENGFIEILTAFHDFNFFYIFLGIYSFKYNRKSMFIKITLFLLIAFVFFKSIVATSKGGIVNLFLIYIISSTILNFKIKPYYIISFVSFSLIFALYSYFIRYYGLSSGSFNFEDLSYNFELYLSTYSNSTPETTSSLALAFDRFYYLDPIIYMSNFPYKTSPYDFGSIRDLQGIIPRLIWNNKPSDLNFGIFLGKTLWHFPKSTSVEIPIGRIGETFYILKWGGLLLVPFLIFVQNLVYEKLFIKGDILLKSMYFFIFFATINADSGWIFYSYRTVFLGLIFCYLINFFVKKRRI